MLLVETAWTFLFQNLAQDDLTCPVEGALLAGGAAVVGRLHLQQPRHAAVEGEGLVLQQPSVCTAGRTDQQLHGLPFRQQEHQTPALIQRVNQCDKATQLR